MKAPSMSCQVQCLIKLVHYQYFGGGCCYEEWWNLINYNDILINFRGLKDCAVTGKLFPPSQKNL